MIPIIKIISTLIIMCQGLSLENPKIMKNQLIDGYIFYRAKTTLEFSCFHCNKVKNSKLVAINSQDSNTCICNACYGELNSKK